MVKVLYTARRLGNMPWHDVVVSLAGYQREGEFPLFSDGDNFYFEKRMFPTYHDDERIPWVFPYSDICPLLDHQKDVCIITPVVSWATIMTVGDPVELCDCLCRSHGLFALVGMKATLLGRLTRHERELFFENASAENDRSLETLVTSLQNCYQVPVNRYTPVVLLELHRVPASGRLYEAMIEVFMQA